MLSLPLKPYAASSDASGSPHISVRAQTKALNRKKIIASALILFGQHGYEGATLRDIARAAGLSTGAVFANFSDKREIFDLIIGVERKRILSLLDQSYDESKPLPERLSEQFRVGYLAAKTHMGVFISALALRWTDAQDPTQPSEHDFANQIRSRVLHCLSCAKVRGEIEEYAPIEVAAGILEDLCATNLRRGYLKGFDDNSLIEVVHSQCEFICRGLGFRSV